MSTRLSSGEVRFFLLWATIAFLVVLLVAGCDVAPERPSDPPQAPKAGMGMRVQGAVFAASADEGAITSIVEEGAALVPLRVRWALPAKPDSQRLTVTDSVSGASYLNVKVAASWRTRTFEAPRDLTLNACDRQYVIGTNLQTALDTVQRGDCIRLPANGWSRCSASIRRMTARSAADTDRGS